MRAVVIVFVKIPFQKLERLLSPVHVCVAPANEFTYVFELDAEVVSHMIHVLEDFVRVDLIEIVLLVFVVFVDFCLSPRLMSTSLT